MKHCSNVSLLLERYVEFDLDILGLKTRMKHKVHCFYIITRIMFNGLRRTVRDYFGGQSFMYIFDTLCNVLD